MGHLHIVFLPLMAHGHMIPTLDMAKLFTARGLKTTIISTPPFAHSVEKARESGHDIGLSILEFPPEKSSLPKNTPAHDLMSNPHSIPMFVEALSLLQEPVEKILQQLNPSCLISDMFLPWTNNSAAKFGIPRLVFHGTSCFAVCAAEQMNRHKPYKNALSDADPFVLQGLPHELTYIRTQVPQHALAEERDAFSMLLEQMRESDRESYGVVFNSFYALEPAYVDHFKKALGMKAWHIGPLLLHNNNNGEMKENVQRGEAPSIEARECLAWLDSKGPNSVVYVSFGTMVTFTRGQMQETAAGLEASGKDFIWVVSRGQQDEERSFSPEEGFEERIRGRGIVVRGWAPQLMILNHPSLGAFVTHCGWNSTLEGICAGVPMVTWPVFGDQFFNEKLATEVLGIGVAVGSKRWCPLSSEGVTRGEVETAVRRAMGDGEMRRRAKSCMEMARNSVEEEGGSSCAELKALIHELSNNNKLCD